MRNKILANGTTEKVSLKWKVFIYFLLFAGVIVLVFWLFQVCLLNGFYGVSMKKNCYITSNLAEKTVNEYNITDINNDNEELVNRLDEITRGNEMNLWIIKEQRNGFITLFGNSVNPLAVQSVLGRLKTSVLKEDFQETDQTFAFSSIDKTLDGSEVVTILEARVVPVDSAVAVWKQQFYMISIIIIVTAIFFAFIVSRTISRPISVLNRAAKSLAKGKYDTEFKANGYIEIEELSDTLNYAASELGKLDGYQKELIANVSHDLRTPLTMIAGYSEMMQDYPSEVTKENLQIIIDEAKRLTSLVNDILNLTKMQSGTVKCEKEDYNLTENIEEIIKRNAKLLTQSGCHISFESTDDVIVNADPKKLEIVIYNFLNNAVNYCGEDKAIIVRQEIIGEKVKISIIDHGVGIAQENLANIWDRYYKVDKTHRRANVGSGLGLSIVKSVLEAHNFEYGVNSELGKGSEFWFIMPIVQRIRSEKNEA